MRLGWTTAKGALNLLYAVLTPTPPGAYISGGEIRQYGYFLFIILSTYRFPKGRHRGVGAGTASAYRSRFGARSWMFGAESLPRWQRSSRSGFRLCWFVNFTLLAQNLTYLFLALTKCVVDGRTTVLSFLRPL